MSKYNWKNYSQFLLEKNELGVESLIKDEAGRKKQFDKMVDTSHPNHNEASTFASKMPNSNWGNWYMRNYKKNPEEMGHPATKQKIQHHMDMANTHPNHYKDIRFDKHHTLESGLDSFGQAEKGITDAMSIGDAGTSKKDINSKRLVDPSGKKVLDMGNGFAWYDLQTDNCSKEGDAMGHCGQTEDEEASLWSMRKEHMFDGGTVRHEPILTAEVDEETKSVNQLFAAGNTKPDPKWHPAIHQLYSNTELFPTTGGYEYENQFHVDDMDDNNFNNLIEKRPELQLLSEKRPLPHDEALALLRGGNQKVHQLLVDNNTTRPEVLHHILEKTPKSNPYDLGSSFDIYRGIAEHPNLSEETAMHMINDKEYSNHISNIAWKSKSPDILTAIYNKNKGKKKDYSCIEGISRNKNTPSRILAVLGRNSNGVGFGVAPNPNTPSKTLESLIDRFPKTSQAWESVGNPNLSQDRIKKLFDKAVKSKAQYYLANRLVSNPSTPAHMISRLLDKHYDDTVLEVPNNPNATSDVLLHIAKKNSDNWDILRRIALHDNATPEILEIAVDESPANVAQSPNITDDIAMTIVKKHKEYSRQFLAKNPAISDTVLKILMEDKEDEVKRAAHKAWADRQMNKSQYNWDNYAGYLLEKSELKKSDSFYVHLPKGKKKKGDVFEITDSRTGKKQTVKSHSIVGMTDSEDNRESHLVRPHRDITKSEPLAKNYFKGILNKIKSGQKPDERPKVKIWDEMKAGIISDIRDKGGNPWPNEGSSNEDLFTLHAKLAMKYHSKDKKPED